MIELYYYTSPNARKALMMLEEVGLPYAVRWTDISAGDQHRRAVRRDQSEPEDSGPDRLRWPGRTIHHAVRVRRHPAVPGREDRASPADGSAAPLERHQVAVLADIEPGAAARAGGALREPRREPWHRRPVRGRPLPQRGRAALRRAGARNSQAATTSTDEFSIADIAAFPGCGSRRGRA